MDTRGKTDWTRRLTGAAALLVGVTSVVTAQDTKPVVRVSTSAATAAPSATSLANAAMRGDLASVRALLAQRADVNSATGDGMTALHWAAERGDVAMVQALIKAGANIKATTRNGGHTALHVAAKSGNSEVVKALLAGGADARAVTSSGATSLHLAAQAGDAASITALVAGKADVNAKETSWGQTPLMFAAALDRSAAVTALLKAGANPAVKTSTQDLTEELARQQAAARKRNEVLFDALPQTVKDSIIKAAEKAALAAIPAGRGGPPGAPGAAPGAPAGAPAGAQAAQQRQMATPATAAPATAAAAGAAAKPDSAKKPAYKVGLAAPPVNDLTPAQIQAAIMAGRTVYTSELKDKSTEQVIPLDTTNGFQAGYEGTVGSVGGLTALLHAARQGNVAASMALIDGGANINEPSLSDSTTPLLMATINGHFDLAMQLVKRGANVKAESIHGLTPLYAALNIVWHPTSRYPQPQAVQNQKTTHIELMDAMIKAGADVNVRLRKNIWFFGFSNCGNANCGLELLDGTSPFWRAAYAVDLDAMKLLKAAGANDTMPSYRPPQANRRRGGGEGFGGPPATAIDASVDSAAKAVPPGIGTYPVHAAAGVGYGNGFAGNAHRHAPDGWMPAMKYLVEELHHDVNKRDLGGYTPLHHAAARGDNEMILYLVSKGADPKAVARDFKTTVDMANGPVQRLRPFPETIQLLEKLGAKNSHRCVGC
ncbi:MAG: ankyrin repeat domain-containing protein [Gemmatimonadaceae bacterium]|nr:ankyrin repeat domain-containing protein [Gemmatimonadaceae bacterium]